MTFKTVLVSAALTLGTTVSAYAGCTHHQQQAMSCAEGSVYDAETKACVPMTTG